MSDILIEVESGKSKRLLTANKVCKDDIIVKATGGSGGSGIDLMSYAKTISFDSSFSEITEPVVLHLEKAISLNQAFYNVYLHCPKITIYVSNSCTNMSQVFRYGAGDTTSTVEEIEIIGDTSNVTTYNQMFNNRNSIKRILGDFDFGKCTNVINMFSRNCNLEEFYPVANTIKISIDFASCSKLIDASIQAIINGLADLTGQTAQTISWHTSVLERLTDEQYQMIFDKNWTVQ
jgi:hypothetical protein